jgi:anti-anti-sigma factor
MACMKTDIYLSEGRLLLRVEGRFVLDDCDPLKKAVLAAMSPAVTDVYVDLSGTDFIDSAGLGTLVSIKMKSNQNKARMTLVSPSPAVEDVLLMSKLNEIFEIAVGDEAAAQVNSLAKPEHHLRTVSPTAEEVVSSSQSPDSLKIEEPKKRAKGPDATQMVEELCRNAVEALRRGNYEESIRLYCQALDMDGDYLPARNNLAIVYEKRPEWKQNAVEQWEVVLRLSEQMGDEKHKERAQKHLQALRG